MQRACHPKQDDPNKARSPRYCPFQRYANRPDQRFGRDNIVTERCWAPFFVDRTDFFLSFFFSFLLFFAERHGQSSLALLASASSPGELVYHFDGLDFSTRSFSSHMCTHPGLSAHTLLKRLLPHRWTEEKEGRFAILHNFVAKCRYICTRNVLQYYTTLLPSVGTTALGMFCGAKYTHHTFIHASHKTSLDYNSSKHQNKKSLLNL